MVDTVAVLRVTDAYPRLTDALVLHLPLPLRFEDWYDSVTLLSSSGLSIDTSGNPGVFAWLYRSEMTPCALLERGETLYEETPCLSLPYLVRLQVLRRASEGSMGILLVDKAIGSTSPPRDDCSRGLMISRSRVDEFGK